MKTGSRLTEMAARRSLQWVLLATLVAAWYAPSAYSLGAPTECSSRDKFFDGSGEDGGSCVVSTGAGTYLLLGWTASEGAGGDDTWLAEIDTDWDIEWQRVIGGAADDYATSAVLARDGGFALAGSTKSYGAGDSDVWLVKRDASGAKEWYKTFGGDAWDVASSVISAGDGGFVLVGSTQSYGHGDTNGWLIKTDADGNLEWSRSYGGAQEDMTVSAIRATDGGLVLAGATHSYGVGNGDAWLIKTDANGDPQWDRTYGATGVDVANCVAQAQDGGYFLVGWTTSYGSGDSDAWLIKTDEHGEREWDKRYGIQGVDDDASCVVATHDGGCALVGSTQSHGSRGQDAWLIKVDAYGNTEWEESFGGLQDDYVCGIHSLIAISPEEYVFIGTTSSFGLDSSAVWLVRYCAAPGAGPAAPETPTPGPTAASPSWTQAAGTTKTYTWEYGGRSWTVDLTFDLEGVAFYRDEMPHPHEAVNYVGYATTPYDDSALNTLIDWFKTTAADRGFSEHETCDFMVAFVQGLPYTTDDVTTGFDEYLRYPLETLYDDGGDCEDTSILLAALLYRMQIDVALLLLPEDAPQHVAVAVAADPSTLGRYISVDGKKYYYLETTGTGWGLGDIPTEYVRATPKFVLIRPAPLFKVSWAKTVARATTDGAACEVTVKIWNYGAIPSDDTVIRVWLESESGDTISQVESESFALGFNQTAEWPVSLPCTHGQAARLSIRVSGDNSTTIEESSDWFTP